MTVSTSISFEMTARDIVEKAMRLINVLGRDENVSAEDGEDARMSLNMMLKTMQADGCNIWREQPSTVTFAASTATLAGALDAMMTEYKHRMREKRNSEATVDFYRKRGAQLLRMISIGKLP